MKKYLIGFLILITSCQNKKTSISKISRVDSLKNSLTGKWGGLNESEPGLKITIDSIYYYNQQKSYPYSIDGNDMIIELEQSRPRLKNIFVIKDTLFFSSRISVDEEVYGIIKAYRYK